MALTPVLTPQVSDSVDGFLVRSLAITYHDGSVVGNHTHVWGQLIYGTSGVMCVSAADKVWFVPPSQAVWLPPKQNHSISILGDVALRTLYLAPAISAILAEEVMALEVSPLLREVVLHIQDLNMLAEGNAGHDRLAGVLVDLLADAPIGQLCLPMPVDSRAVAAARWMQENPAELVELGTVAKQHGCSLRTLQRLFTRETGLTLDTWRQKARLIYAVTQLSNSKNVTEAGLLCGYDSISAFIAAFKKLFGVTPGRFIVSDRVGQK
jgi:AraC-like DNA-binding protein/quercetin dioxygenase-like cupin family protein